MNCEQEPKETKEQTACYALPSERTDKWLVAVLVCGASFSCEANTSYGLAYDSCPEESSECTSWCRGSWFGSWLCVFHPKGYIITRVAELVRVHESDRPRDD